MIHPWALDQGHGGGGVAAGSLGSDVEAVELAVGLVSAGGRIGDVVGQQIEGFHAGAKSTGCDGGYGVHAGRKKHGECQPRERETTFSKDSESRRREG